MILYILLGASCSTSNFNMAKIWNSPDTCGGTKIEFRKSIVIIIYLCFNLFFGCLNFYITNTKRRSDCIMALGIIFCAYNFFRTLAIIASITCSKSIKDEKKLINKIKIKLENEENDIEVKEENENEEDNNNIKKSQKINHEDENENNYNNTNEKTGEDNNNNANNDNENANENHNINENENEKNEEEVDNYN